MKRFESFPGFQVDFSIFLSVILFLSISIKNVPFERKKKLFLSSFLPFPKLLYQTHSHMHFKSLCNNVGVLVTTSYDESRLYFIFYWDRNGWSDEGLVTLLDLALRTLAWGALCVYLRTQLFNSGESKYPFLLKVWWGFFLSFSCYCLVCSL